MFRILAAIVLGGLTIVHGARAQEFPSRNITLMMPYAAGGPGDALARILGLGMSRALGRTVLIENVAGAAGTIGSLKVAQSPPDGHMLLVMHLGHAANVALYRNLRYDAVSDFEPIGMIAESPMAFVGKRSFAAATFPELIAYVKARPGKVAYASFSPGTRAHFAGVILGRRAGLDMPHVGYKGSPPALLDVLGGQVPLMFDSLITSTPHVKAGRLRAYAVAAEARSEFVPEVPTFKELGYPELTLTGGIGLFARRQLAPGVAARIRVEFLAALQASEVRERLAALYFDPATPATRSQLEMELRADYERVGALVRSLGAAAQ